MLVDCVCLGVNYLYDDINFVVFGVNSGCNMGLDIYFFGIIVAVREVIIYWILVIVFFYFKRNDWEIDWERVI